MRCARDGAVGRRTRRPDARRTVEPALWRRRHARSEGRRRRALAALRAPMVALGRTKPVRPRYSVHLMNSSPTVPRPSSEARSRAARSPSGLRGRRTALVCRLLELAPAVRRAFEVKLDAEHRALWRSLTVHQLEALVALEGGPTSMRSLCDRLEISESAGTALVDRLAGSGLVERQDDPDDRRVVRIAASDAARAMVAQYQELKRDRLATVLADLPTDDLATLVRIYESVLTSTGGSR